jgi:cell wall-associated NlpC family hydrolase
MHISLIIPRLVVVISALIMFCSCDALMNTPPIGDTLKADVDSVTIMDSLKFKDTLVAKVDTSTLVVSKLVINTGNVQPNEVVEFAKTLIGVKYKYGSIDPNQGFDCSGFITYVFNHFNIKVPRSSIDFTDVGRTVLIDSSKPGDIILFTGTDSTERHVGHMGIVVSNINKQLEFIHSTSGKQFGVTITPLNGYYIGRFVRIARIFETVK